MKKLVFLSLLYFQLNELAAQQPVPVKPRILVSTDIGGTDPDDNQSMAHLLMYSDRFNIEGLVSSPSYGKGNKEEILRMIGLYEKDLPKLQTHQKGLATPRYLRSVVKQGRQGNATYAGYTAATEGSNWIIRCAKKKTAQPLWVLVWGGLEDLAQALHDAPEIQNKIKVYWIGGPNKKWSANSYAYITKNFPALWFIEVNASYYGFFSNNNKLDSIKSTGYYEQYIQSAGYLGKDFKNYYNGEVKMGDTPSLLYMMDGDPNNPLRESWGGSFEKFDHSSRVIFNNATTVSDTIAFCAIIEFNFEGPKVNLPADSACFWMEVPYGKTAVQKWPGYYLGNGQYALRYIPKQAETLRYTFTSSIPGFPLKEGAIVVSNLWPGKRNATDYQLGNNWYTDKSDPSLYNGKIQGGETISKWRQAVLLDWAKRWEWLK
ncbi:nucleoside hydrolase-like domain-containing protein [Ferruginibacter sp.]